MMNSAGTRLFFITAEELGKAMATIPKNHPMDKYTISFWPNWSKHMLTIEKPKDAMNYPVVVEFQFSQKVATYYMNDSRVKVILK